MLEKIKISKWKILAFLPAIFVSVLILLFFSKSLSEFLIALTLFILILIGFEFMRRWIEYCYLMERKEGL